ncbi:hypothetical protein [Amycolatopsis sp. NPDC051716]|uniref:hypothetical protein n=1 Tax=Amycolatopsis sp. NPDC051716 TaxID=3155804 RepID=UPI003426DAA5
MPAEHVVCCGGDGGRAGRVDDYGVDRRVFGANVGEPVCAAAADDDSVTSEPWGEAEPDAGGGAGDEDGVAAGVHLSVRFSVRWSRG